MQKPTSTRRRRNFRLLIGVPAAVIGVLVVVILGVLIMVIVQGRATPAGDSEYVALGSSFASAPGVTTRAANSPDLCGRSADNYAHIVARKTGLNLTDTTCAGANISHVMEGGQYFQGPQLEAIKPSTRVVTITVGGNDVFYLGNLSGQSCQNEPSVVPPVYRLAGVCSIHSGEQVDAAFTALPNRLAEIVRRIHDVAPEAQVIFVEYTTILPDKGTCEALPISNAEADTARAVAAKLHKTMASVADETGATLVRASSLTHGHDVCSDDPWVYGFEYGNNPFGHGVIAYHPRLEAMEQIAAAVSAAIE